MAVPPQTQSDEAGAQSASRAGPHLQFFTEIGIIDQLASNRLQRALPEGVSLAQFGVMTHFVRRGGQQTPASLADAFQVTRGAMTNTLHRLEAHGYVLVSPDEKDGRSKQVCLTPKGEAAYHAIAAALAPLNADLAAAFPAARLLEAMPVLVELRQWLDDHR